MKLKSLARKINLGCDPELFLTRNGEVIESSEVIAEAGIGGLYGNPATLVRDGVQVELNPGKSNCRATIGAAISQALMLLKSKLADNLDVSFNPVIEVPAEKLSKMSEKARRLGCAPSVNAHNQQATIGVNAETYTKRSAGGHIHLGFDYNGWASDTAAVTNDVLMASREKMVPVLDILLGNTCVLLDRDPMQAERRKVYGRAGEYRLPKHGLEYRTLSNFWLRHYALTSFVLAQARMAVEVVYSGLEAQLMSLVDLKDIVQAINTNDADLAKANFERIRPFVAEIHEASYNDVMSHDTKPLCAEKLADFDFFLTKPIEEWFPLDPMTHWTVEYPNYSKSAGARTNGHYFDAGHNLGWESFLQFTVQPARLAHEKLAKEVNNLYALNGSGTQYVLPVLSGDSTHA